MKDPNLIVRTSFKYALEGQLTTYDDTPVPIADDLYNGDSNVYVIISSQTAVDNSTFSSFVHECTILLDIVHKQQYSVTRHEIDRVAQQIFNIVKPTPSTYGVSNALVTFVSVKVDSDNYLDFTLDGESLIRRLIRFSLIVHEKQ